METGWGDNPASSVSGKVKRPSPSNELGGLNYNETDNRHTIATHKGWTPVDGNSGPMNPATWEKSGDFENGPAPFKQT